jgi:hypothetical protein
MYLDVFSCKKFDIPTVEETIQKYFKPLAVKKVYLERNAEHVVIDNPSW